MPLGIVAGGDCICQAREVCLRPLEPAVSAHSKGLASRSADSPPRLPVSIIAEQGTPQNSVVLSLPVTLWVRGLGGVARPCSVRQTDRSGSGIRWAALAGRPRMVADTDPQVGLCGWGRKAEQGLSP